LLRLREEEVRLTGQEENRMDAQRSLMRREADERREVAARRDTRRRADLRRGGIRRATMMGVSRERRELSDLRTNPRRITRDQRNPETRRVGARRGRIDRRVI